LSQKFFGPLSYFSLNIKTKDANTFPSSKFHLCPYVSTEVIDTQSHFEECTVLYKYIRNMSIMNTRTAHEYYLRLISFQKFITSRYKTKIKNGNKDALDNIITQINKGSEDPYDILSDYITYMPVCLHSQTLNEYYHYHRFEPNHFPDY
jgi:hypothetical protein